MKIKVKEPKIELEAGVFLVSDHEATTLNGFKRSELGTI